LANSGLLGLWQYYPAKKIDEARIGADVIESRIKQSLHLGARLPAFACKQVSRLNQQVGKSCNILGRGQARTEVRMATSPALAPTDIETWTIRKLRTRIIPFIFVLMVIAFLDRIN